MFVLLWCNNIGAKTALRNVGEIDIWAQFHQHYMRSFCTGRLMRAHLTYIKAACKTLVKLTSDDGINNAFSLLCTYVCAFESAIKKVAQEPPTFFYYFLCCSEKKSDLVSSIGSDSSIFYKQFLF